MVSLPERITSPSNAPPPRPIPGRRIGSHTSTSGGVSKAAERAHALGSNTFQIFSASPRMWKASPISSQEARITRILREKHDLYPLVIHTNYLINLAASDPAIRRKSIEAFRGELQRAIALSAEYVVTHPGSAGNGDRDEALTRFVTGLEEAARGLKLGNLRVLVENTSGGGGSLGCDFTELRSILSMTTGVPIGCCLDTAHCYQAGWDVSTAPGLDALLKRLADTIGLDCIRVVHTNDSRTQLGSRCDRHEHIGRGGIGLEGFRRILNHPSLREKAFILETPIEEEGDDLRNLETIRSLCRNGLHAAHATAHQGAASRAQAAKFAPAGSAQASAKVTRRPVRRGPPLTASQNRKRP